MAPESLNPHDIENSRQYLVQAERSYQLDQENVLREDDFRSLRDEKVPDALWLGAVALLITDDGLDGDAIVARNQKPILAARTEGFTVGEIAEYAVLNERRPLR